MKKVLTPFRIWENDREKWKAKVIIDKTSMQKSFEILVKMYLENDEAVMKRIKSVSKEKYARRVRHNEFSELEVNALYHKIAEVSPLAEMENILNEIDKENK